MNQHEFIGLNQCPKCGGIYEHENKCARQLALEKWMEEVSKFVRQHKYLGVRDVDSALEEYKRASKP